jgi:hypothetical protein
MSTRTPRTRSVVENIEGQILKPARTLIGGEVLFTQNGDNFVQPDQETCEAYGYTYDKSSSTCYAFNKSNNLVVADRQSTNDIKGGGNTIRTGVINNDIRGGKNTFNGLNRNDVTIGDENNLANGVNNTITIGQLTNVTTNNSLYIGGNTDGDLLGERQSIQLVYGCQTTGTANVSSGINNVAGVRYAIPDNCIIYFHADTIAVRTAGSSGTGAVGDYASYVERGVIINKSGTASIQRERDTIKTSGTVTNWRILASVGLNNTLALQCRGNTNQTIEWCMNVTITQITTNVSL